MLAIQTIGETRGPANGCGEALKTRTESTMSIMSTLNK